MFKILLRATCVALGLSIAPAAALAQEGQPIQLIVPYNPGGGSDLFARLVAPGLGKALNQTVIVENRAGAGGIIGTEAVVRSTPPNKMLLVSDSAVYSIIPSLYTPLSYSRKDLIPVANLATFGNVLVVPANSRFKTFQDLLETARKSPGKLSIGSSGTGGITHLAAERLMEQAKIKLVHVPYKGSGPAITDTAGGHIDMVFTGLPSVLELLRSGKLRALAIATDKRSPYAPEIPTISESGVPGFSALISQGLFAPVNTPPETVQKLNQAVQDFMNQPDTKETLRKMMVEPVYQSSAEYKTWLDKESSEWAALIKRADIKVQ
ncbi:MULTISPECIES: Bug family tripartite tricarboxylate transporter substrate binding protein [Achromobacter]|uniref:Tripartite tricarboxylate transporter substrate binding protein n=1 Tax=Achromobacter spanius TaxID=217203 RepID=A0ABY8H0Q4_9BURK|nr:MULTISPECIES: tripartite tricarboxylate transporter substrate binding protein [Achromobacter]WAI85586.1 tripartite tricarboxylate transporter substrate binding protein [Achromobacter spanius]WEX95668.1 tripartite tricarboxylate transporter substrate binding protein [Achromobacter sp. SS2-2022]WFP10612.1 tripartite tricarboxylate transporter substrate binding protein [Achromobacter spanius]